jgi:hypothetical protein
MSSTCYSSSWVRRRWTPRVGYRRRLTPWYTLKSTELVYEPRNEPSGRITAKKKTFSGPFSDCKNTQYCLSYACLKFTLFPSQCRLRPEMKATNARSLQLFSTSTKEINGQGVSMVKIMLLFFCLALWLPVGEAKRTRYPRLMSVSSSTSTVIWRND